MLENSFLVSGEFRNLGYAASARIYVFGGTLRAHGPLFQSHINSDQVCSAILSRSIQFFP